MVAVGQSGVGGGRAASPSQEQEMVSRRCSARLSTAVGGSSSSHARAAARDAQAVAAAARRRARAHERVQEVEDSPRVVRDKCRHLAKVIAEAKHLVVYTGAGISTAACIPDYRGPSGVWTRLRRGEAVPRVDVALAEPTYTHMALMQLHHQGMLKFLVSQNCDGLHIRSGVPRRALAELHGDMFAERCGACRRVYLRAFDTTERTARHAHGTRRLCHRCGVELRDSIVHFGERGGALWPLNWSGALRHAAKADVVLCLGSSLKVLRRYPRLWCMHRAPQHRPRVYIVNLQWTPKDTIAELKINARCDIVMAEVARHLRLTVPRYRAHDDPLLAHAVPLAPQERHTTRARPLRSPPPVHTSDDEDTPLKALADRLHAPTTTAALPPAPAGLCAFTVTLAIGEATILLHARHAPLHHPTSPAGTTSALRRFRMHRTRPPKAPPWTRNHTTDSEEEEERRTVRSNGTHCGTNGTDCGTNGTDRVTNGTHCVTNGTHCVTEPIEQRVSDSVKREIKSEYNDDSPLSKRTRVKLASNHCNIKCEWRDDGVKLPPTYTVYGASVKRELSPLEPSGRMELLAATYIARAVAVCRSQLYSGLHTIIPPPSSAPSAASSPRKHSHKATESCSWCLRRHGARRCLWYGAPPVAPRTPHPRTGALCACCDRLSATTDSNATTGTNVTAGWYGKGYRKGRRR